MCLYIIIKRKINFCFNLNNIMSFLFIISGESFRLGSQMTRGRGSADSYYRQKIATDSHLDFISFIKEKYDFSCDILLNTHKLNPRYDNDLLSWYGSRVISKNLYNGSIKNENVLFDDTINMLKKIDLQKYEFIFMTRPDMYLKKHF